MTPAERAAALAAFLDATTPGWASGLAADPLVPPGELFAELLAPHARRVGVDVATYARAHGWITGELAGPFEAAWRAECEKRGRGAGARPPVLTCAFCGHGTTYTPAPGAPVRCYPCSVLARGQCAWL